MAINLSNPPRNNPQPNKIWVGINIDFISEKKSIIEKIIGKWNDNSDGQIDFDISVIATDKNGKMPSDDCLIFYGQISSIGINLDTYDESPIAPEYDEIISIDFSRIQSEISSLKFILSNHKDELFKNCIISCFVYDKPIWTGPSGKELIEFKIQPTISFNLLELFEINIDNKNKWGLNVVENPINSISTNCFGEYIGKHFK